MELVYRSKRVTFHKFWWNMCCIVSCVYIQKNYISVPFGYVHNISVEEDLLEEQNYQKYHNSWDGPCIGFFVSGASPTVVKVVFVWITDRLTLDPAVSSCSVSHSRRTLSSPPRTLHLTAGDCRKNNRFFFHADLIILWKVW